nr:unnamed protein product [Digitaria exilis]
MVIDSINFDATEFVEDLWHFLDPIPLPVDDFTEFVSNDLKSRNYPMPIRLEGGMRLINNFEEKFVEDTWSKLSKKVASNISQSVVSLASFKGKLMATSGIVTEKESNLDCKDLMISTCKITKAGIGGPLIDFGGNFVGMNFYGRKETHYLPKSTVLEWLRRFERYGFHIFF